MPKFDDIAPVCLLLVSCSAMKSKEWYIAGEAHNWLFKKGVNNFSAPGIYYAMVWTWNRNLCILSLADLLCTLAAK